MFICLHMCVCVCVCVCVYIHVYVFVCVCVGGFKEILILTVQIVKISVPPSIFVQQGLNIGM